MNPSEHKNASAVSRRAVLAAAAGVAASPILRADSVAARPPKSVIYIFLSGGLAQQDSFDPKPDAAVDIRGEFNPIATQTPGLQVCEHLPMLAARSNNWSVVRSLSHSYNEHSQGHMAMLTGRSDLPQGFNPSLPRPADHPSIAAILGSILPEKDGLPASIVLPEKLIHRTGRVIPGQFAGLMGPHRDPWILAASRFNAKSYGAWPEYEFHHQRGGETSNDLNYRTPGLALPDELTEQHFDSRLQLLNQFETTGAPLAKLTETKSFNRVRERALSMLGDGRLNKLFDIHSAPDKEKERYGKNTFGWSLLLAKRLVKSGVSFVQVNLGNNETWDTHGNAFPNLKNYLLPPMDRAVSALLDDLDKRGMLDSTLVVMAGEFGRTPKISRLPQHYAAPGRDHWGALQSVMLAGAGYGEGRIIGSSDKQAGQPRDNRQSPENLVATMYSALGIPQKAHWYDLQDRPMHLYGGGKIKTAVEDID